MMEKEPSSSEYLLRLVMWAGAHEAEDVCAPVIQWLFDAPMPEHETFAMQVDVFFMRVTGTALPAVEKKTGAGERLLRRLEELETPGSERQQYALLYYAMALGLAYVADIDGDGGTGAGVPALPLIPPRSKVGRETFPGGDDPS